MRFEEAEAIVRSNFHVDPADVRSARGFLLDSQVTEIDVLASGREWAADSTDIPVPNEIQLSDGDPTAQLIAFARFHSRFFAFCLASIELIRDGLALSAAHTTEKSVHLGLRVSGQGGGREMPDLCVIYPTKLFRPRWLPAHSGDPARDDVYLRGLARTNLHPGVADAMRTALRCFRHELFLPALAMLDSAVEGAWMECGLAMTDVLPTNSQALSLRKLLEAHHGSLMERVNQIQRLYVNGHFQKLRDLAEVRQNRLIEIGQWSDLIRQSRNVLHWGVDLALPNDYAKTAQFLAPALQNLKDIRTVYEAAIKLKP